jgi:hypothetical protein
VLLFLVVKVKFNAGAIFVALAGVGFVIIGLNHAQIPGAALTLSAIIHHNTAIAVVVMLPLACLFLAPRLKAKGYSSLYYYSLGTGIFYALFFIFGGLILVSHLSMVGIYERILLWSGQLWVEIVCARFIYGLIKERSASRLLLLPAPAARSSIE